MKKLLTCLLLCLEFDLTPLLTYLLLFLLLSTHAPQKADGPCQQQLTVAHLEIKLNTTAVYSAALTKWVTRAPAEWAASPYNKHRYCCSFCLCRSPRGTPSSLLYRVAGARKRCSRNLVIAFATKCTYRMPATSLAASCEFLSKRASLWCACSVSSVPDLLMSSTDQFTCRLSKLLVHGDCVTSRSNILGVSLIGCTRCRSVDNAMPSTCKDVFLHSKSSARTRKSSISEALCRQCRGVREQPCDLQVRQTALSMLLKLLDMAPLMRVMSLGQNPTPSYLPKILAATVLLPSHSQSGCLTLHQRILSVMSGQSHLRACVVPSGCCSPRHIVFDTCQHVVLAILAHN